MCYLRLGEKQPQGAGETVIRSRMPASLEVEAGAVEQAECVGMVMPVVTSRRGVEQLGGGGELVERTVWGASVECERGAAQCVCKVEQPISRQPAQQALDGGGTG